MRLKMCKKLTLATLVSIALSTASATGALAQSAGTYDDATLSQFVDAYVQIAQISESLGSELSSVQDQAQAQAMQEEAQVEMVQAVEDAGLTVAEYNAIAYEVETDPELKQRIDAQMNGQ